MKLGLLFSSLLAAASLTACFSDSASLSALDGEGLGRNDDSNLMRLDLGTPRAVTAWVHHPEIEGSTTYAADDVRPMDTSVLRVERRPGDNVFLLVPVSVGETMLGIYLDGCERARLPIKINAASSAGPSR